MNNENILVNVVCRKDKKNQQNIAPIYIRIRHNKKCKFIYLKEKINVELWDFETNQIKPECPNKEYLEIVINDKKQEIEKKILSLKLSDKPFTIDDIIEPVNKKKRNINNR
ncbi:hypothetical protein D0T49_00480 [Paludibacter sp. 221]|uniref:Arm DNA-binding domain-containing protein n=1 Tax=Paludibacter sp. 221 TaxID=2302939 RepID=UPI0013D1C6B1|nr:Arm DNA-binding domain-containing protein [Paludibacter sp. 221]NDV45529.1 hypothetical protein [Paludibacter sp. 221]